MKRVLSGIQPSGQLHLGNYAGAIRQFIDMQDDHEMFIFVASYHALTSGRDADLLRASTRQVVIDYIAFGLDPAKANIYLQQDVPQVTELCWLLACVCPKHMMDKATSYKDKVAKGLPASIGLYIYPILQAADILAVDPDFVPVGEDQRQHVEITRDLAEAFNRAYGPVFKVPQLRIRPDAGVLPGLDGQKMSKSYGNTIDLFEDARSAKKKIMAIKTDSTPVESPKNPDTCTVFALLKLFLDATELAEWRQRYEQGGMGYGDAKKRLAEAFEARFGPAREKRAALEKDTGYVEEVLTAAGKKARAVAQAVMKDVRRACGIVVST